MLVVRNVFRLRLGHAKPAVAAMKESLDMMKRAGIKSPVRMLTDLTGPAYTLVLENTYQNLQEFEAEGKQVMGNPEFGRVVPRQVRPARRLRLSRDHDGRRVTRGAGRRRKRCLASDRSVSTGRSEALCTDSPQFSRCVRDDLRTPSRWRWRVRQSPRRAWRQTRPSSPRPRFEVTWIFWRATR